MYEIVGREILRYHTIPSAAAKLYKKFSIAVVNFLSLNFSSFITCRVLSSFATARPFKLLIKLWVLSDNSYKSTATNCMRVFSILVPWSKDLDMRLALCQYNSEAQLG